MSHSVLRKAGLALLSGGIALTGALAAAPTASAAPDDDSAAWLAGQLRRGVVYNNQFDFNDYGLTADVGFALTETGGEQRAVNQMSRALQRKVDSWTTGADFGAPRDIFAGSTAKALVFAEDAGVNPRRFGGRNLVRRMNSLVLTGGATDGRVRDRGETDYTNVFGQAFAVQGLRRINSPRAGAATRYLLQQQCDGGFFRLQLPAEDAADQSCGADATPDFDATAISVLSLQALPRQGKVVRRATRDALAWMVSEQRDNGSFGGGPSTTGSNTNSTGLAAWALGQARYCGPARGAARWVNRLSLDNGAIAYDRAAYRTAQQDGISAETRDQFRRATAQAAPGLAYLSVRRCRN